MKTINAGKQRKFLAARILCGLLLGAYLTGGYCMPVAWGNGTDATHIYEDDTVKVQTLIGLGFDNLILDSGTRKRLAESDTIIFPVAGNGLLGFNTSILVAPCVIFNITNKTNEPLELDLNRSQISLCNYQGRGVQQGTKYNGAATSEQPPVMIFPKATKEVTLWRTDHQFHDGYYFQGQALVPAKWMPPFDAVPNKNLLGDMMLCINKNNSLQLLSRLLIAPSQCLQSLEQCA